MKKYLLILLAAGLCACDSLRPETVDVIQLGMAPDDITVPATAGEDGVRLISDRDYKMEIIEGGDWLSKGIAISDSLSFHFKANEGFRRSGRIRIEADSRSDELVIKQEGVYVEKIQLSEHSLSAPAEGLNVSIRVYSNLPSDYFSLSVSNDKAISHLRLEDYILSFDVNPTTNRDKRTYEITVACTDGWGETVSDRVSITQEALD